LKVPISITDDYGKEALEDIISSVNVVHPNAMEADSEGMAVSVAITM
jgi:hypothetical protein